MVYGVSTQPIAAINSLGSGTITAPKASELWRVVWKHRSGGIKGDWYINNTDCPIEKIKYQNSLSGCGAADIALGMLNFPIDAGDIVDIYYNGTIDYQGVVEVRPDKKGGNVELIQRGKIYDNLLHSAAYSAKTISFIFAAVCNAAQTDSGLVYNATVSDFDTDPAITITYAYETTKKILSDLVKRLPGRYLHIDANGQVSCRALEVTESGAYYQNDEPAFTSLEKTTDYSGIKATRYQVYRKSSATNARAGEVGYTAPYDTLAIETLVGKIESKFTVPETVANDAAALVAAYAELQNQEFLEAIEVKNIDFEKWKPNIFELVTVQDTEQEILRTIIACDQLDDTDGEWTTGASLDTSVYCEGIASIEMTGLVAVYSFDQSRRYNGLQRVGLMIRSDVAGAYLSLAVSTALPSGAWGAGMWGAGIWPGLDYTAGTTIRKINIDSANTWNYFDVLYSGQISHIIVIYSGIPATAPTINIDRVQVFERNRETYTDNVVEYQVEVKPSETTVNATLKAYKKAANGAAFDTNEVLRRVAVVQQV